MLLHCEGLCIECLKGNRSNLQCVSAKNPEFVERINPPGLEPESQALHRLSQRCRDLLRSSGVSMTTDMNGTNLPGSAMINRVPPRASRRLSREPTAPGRIGLVQDNGGVQVL